MKTSLILRITLTVAVVIAVAIPAVIAQNVLHPERQLAIRKLKDVIVEGIPTCKRDAPTGDTVALRICLKGKIIAFLKEQSQKKRTASAMSQVLLPTPVLSSVSPSTSTLQNVKVARVVDGDTIEIEGGERVRYIGIDTPETVDPRKPVQCFGKEASARNKELVEGKDIRLEKDVSATDRYGRLLRYVYVGDTLINEQLVKEGYARASSYPPDIKYQDTFRAAEQDARANNRGLWEDCGTATATVTVTPSSITSPIPTRTPYPTATQKPKSTPIILPEVEKPSYERSSNAPSSSDCGSLVTCGSLTSCEEAYYYLNTCGQKRLDGDGDGTPCETLCK